MKFHKTEIPGLLRITQDRFHDERGFFGRHMLREEFHANGLVTDFAQMSLAHNPKKGTLRGLHFQENPHAEDKFVACVRGAIFDVAVDIRPDSPTYKKWYGYQLTAENGEMLYVPKGCLHGYLTLVDETTVQYGVSTPYSPAHSKGYLWNDPAFNVQWPKEYADTGSYLISDKDRAWAKFAG